MKAGRGASPSLPAVCAPLPDATLLISNDRAGGPVKRILLAVTAALAVTEFAGSAQAAPVTVCNMVKASGYAKVVARRRAAGGQ